MNHTAGLTTEDTDSFELVPPLREPRVLGRLRRGIEQSERIRAAIAYWSVHPSAVSEHLVSRLAGDGFLCVDIHLPTDIDILYNMKAAGANVFLHLLDPNPQPGDLKSRMPEYLLHSKLLLLDYPRKRAEIWVGSHNWTNRALSGLNIEASLVSTLKREAPLYMSAERFLDGVRLLCEPFDLSSRAYYKWLQGQATEEEPVWVLEVQGEAAPQLSDKRVTVFEASEEQYGNLRNVDKDLIVAALEPHSRQDFLYKATITDTGRLTGAGVTFGPRIHGFHTGRDRPALAGPAIPASRDIAHTAAWATVQIKESIPVAFALFELPPAERWRVVKDDEFEDRVSTEDRRLFVKPAKPLVRRPVSRAGFEGRADKAPYADKSEGEHQLVRKMVMRKRE